MSFKKKKVEAALGNLFSGSKKPAEDAKPAVKKPRTKPAPPQPSIPPAEVAAASTPPEPPAPEKTAETAQPAPETVPLPTAPASLTNETAVNSIPAQQADTAAAVKSPPPVPPVEGTPIAVVQPPQPSAPAPEKPAAQPQESKGKEEICLLVIFNLAGEAFGLPIERVESIIQPQAITVVPNARPYVVGVTNLRGTVLPVIDLRRRFNLPDTKENVDRRIVVVLYNDEKIGLRVDSVSQVLRLPVDAIEPPPALVTAAVHSGFITGVAKVEDQLVILLDLEKVLATESQA